MSSAICMGTPDRFLYALRIFLTTFSVIVNLTALTTLVWSWVVREIHFLPYFGQFNYLMAALISSGVSTYHYVRLFQLDPLDYESNIHSAIDNGLLLGSSQLAVNLLLMNAVDRYLVVFQQLNSRTRFCTFTILALAWLCFFAMAILPQAVKCNSTCRCAPLVDGDTVIYYRVCLAGKCSASFDVVDRGFTTFFLVNYFLAALITIVLYVLLVQRIKHMRHERRHLFEVGCSDGAASPHETHKLINVKLLLVSVSICLRGPHAMGLLMELVTRKPLNSEGIENVGILTPISDLISPIVIMTRTPVLGRRLLFVVAVLITIGQQVLSPILQTNDKPLMKTVKLH